MQRGRRYDVSSVCADINTRCQRNLVADESSRMREVEMAAATTGPAFHCNGHRAVLALEVLQCHIAAMPHINIEHDQAGNRPRDDTDPGLRPCAKPAKRFRLTDKSVLKVLP